MRDEKKQWPVLLVSGQFGMENDDAFRLRELAAELEQAQECSVIPSNSYEDALEVFLSRADLGCVITDWDIPEESAEKMYPEAFVKVIRQRNRTIPIVLLTDRLET